MPRPPPRPLRLPDLVTNPQARAEYIQSHPPIHQSPYATSSRTNSAHYSNSPPSPSSTTDVNSHRASAATLASSGSPVTPASTHTSLSVHNSPWLSEFSKRVSGSPGLMPTAGGIEEVKADKKARTSWSNAFASTKSWFGNAPTTEPKDTGLTPERNSSQKEIKLSPSMIAAHERNSVALPSRPVSSPYPAAAEPPPLSPTGSTFSSCRTPRVGSGLRYYTERNPAPLQARVQIPDPIDPQGHDPPRSTLNPQQPASNGPTPTLTTFAELSKQLPTDTTSQGSARLKDAVTSRGPPSPPPTPPKNVRDSDVPDIRVSSGDDL